MRILIYADFLDDSERLARRDGRAPQARPHEPSFYALRLLLVRRIARPS